MPLSVGDRVEGKYRVVGVLGEGGMGTVYEAVHERIRRRVAIKVVKPSVAQDTEMLRRFEREAQAASRVASRHVVEVFDVGELASGEPFMILEYLEGRSLSQLLRGGKTLPVERVFWVALQILRGLEAAHDAGIVHRDLKPANIFVARTDDGAEVVKILDFGVSKFQSLTGDSFTQTGAIIGTPHYIAPEQTKGARNADLRSDLYSVGAIMFRALTGRTPYRAETIHELIAMLISQDPPPTASLAPASDPMAADIVDRALMRDPADRHQNATEFIAAIEHWFAANRVPLPRASAPAASLQGLLARHSDDETTELWTPLSGSSELVSLGGMQTTPVSAAGAPRLAAPAASPQRAHTSASPASGQPPPVLASNARISSVPLSPGNERTAGSRVSTSDSPSYATPSPSALEPTPAARSRSPALLMAVVALLLVAAGGGGALWLIGSRTVATGQTSSSAEGGSKAEPDAAPSAGSGALQPAEQGSAAVAASATSAAATAEPSASAVASASAATSPARPPASRPAPRPRAAPAPRPRAAPAPGPPPKPGGEDRDFRTDL